MKAVEEAWVTFAKSAGYSIHDQTAYIAFEGGWECRDSRSVPSDAQRAEIYREAARFLRSSDNPRQGDRTVASVSYTMDDAGYDLFQRAKQIEGA